MKSNPGSMDQNEIENVNKMTSSYGNFFENKSRLVAKRTMICCIIFLTSNSAMLRRITYRSPAKCTRVSNDRGGGLTINGRLKNILEMSNLECWTKRGVGSASNMYTSLLLY